MLEAAAGYFDGERVATREKIFRGSGQEDLTLAKMLKKAEETTMAPIDFSKFRSGGRYGIDKDAQEYVKELRSNDRF